MGIGAHLRAWASHDPLLQGRPDADPRLHGPSSQRNPNAGFLAERSQGDGNSTGPELAVYRAVRWLTNRRRG